MDTELKNKVSQVTVKLGEATETLEEVIGAERDQLTIQWNLDTATRVETMEEMFRRFSTVHIILRRINNGRLRYGDHLMSRVRYRYKY